MNKMKMNSVLGSAALTAAFVLMPFAASAATLNASSTTGVIISPNGIVRVIGADVTAISNGVVNAMTTIGNTVLSWIVNISPTTKVSGNGTVNASTTGIAVGDKVSFKGALTGTTSPFTVAATKIRDLTTSFPFRHVIGGKISSVNSANASFVITKGDRSVTVQTNASTTIIVNGTATTTLASLKAGDEVKVSGTANADGSVITATKVVVRTEKDEDDDNDNNRGDNRGKDKDKDHEVNARAELRANANASFKDGHEGKGKGLNLFGGLRLGLDKDD